jgi:peptide deformylase
MALLEILHYPDDRLHRKAKPIDLIDSSVKVLAENMLDTMYHAQGIGLAAVQVNIPLRIVVIDISETHDQPLVIINPEIIEKEGKIASEEGCLSVPGIYDVVQRFENIIVNFQNLDGTQTTLPASGLLSRCIQHEIDHLDGKVFVEHLSRLKQDRIRHKIKKQKR